VKLSGQFERNTGALIMNPDLQEKLSVIQAIQLILAPGVMISACGLLLLSISNKFTSVLNRIRALTEEKRKILIVASGRQLSETENRRLESISPQVKGLLSRAKLIRNSVFSYLMAIGLFVATSLLIGIDYFLPTVQLRYFILGSFLAGLVLVFFGVILGALDIMRGFEIVEIEVEVKEQG
jgi:hypothetical protein